MEMEGCNFVAKIHQKCNMCYTCILSEGKLKNIPTSDVLNIYGKGKPFKKRGMYQPYPQAPGTGLRRKVKEWEAVFALVAKRLVAKETTNLKLTNFTENR
ncbi:hypothetical protein TNIN_364701 [Trichonephila inaurata madagascariensis]|uniref:Uncharacterized protein n=1 Tax=Trichonephila inaurata madagascariensis TaxID=2747483 RepID=A0A8X6WS74_9ARAC|nr:hypothetical protein TNIN_364701 [Trichonephila inaurata madagascariensis]